MEGKFRVYENAAICEALNKNSVRPNKSTLLIFFIISIASAFILLAITNREDGFISSLRLREISPITSYLLAKAIQTLFGTVFLGSVLALIKALSLWRARSTAGTAVVPSSKGTKEQTCLTSRQLALIGIRPKVAKPVAEQSKKPDTTKYNSVPHGDPLVPLHQTVTSLGHSSQYNGGRNTSSGSKPQMFSTPSKSCNSQSPLYQLPSAQISPSIVSSPWSGKRASSTKEIATEEELERFLLDVGDKITGSGSKLATPPPTIGVFGIATPNTISTSANTSGTTRSTPLRPVRMSPGSQKFTTPPKKGELDLPPPMSMEESIEAFERMGIYPEIELWRDQLRQWFSSVLLCPLLNTIENSHIKVMQAAAKLGVSITVSKVGTDSPNTGTSVTVSPIERSNEWKPAISLDEDGLLHQLRATLVQALDASMRNIQQSSQQNPAIPVIQECIDAIAEHQRLQALMKGEWAKGLLPKSSVRADYTVQRIQELAEGTCVKNYEYLGSGEVYDKKNRKWTVELPSDSHLLLYLFCAFLEHPKWMLHVDPTSYAGSQSSKNPLFLGVLPPKDRFPEKYVAVVSGLPSVLHPGSCILAVGRQSPPIFALYWDKKPQFSLQGRTALWDSILLLCYRIKVAYGGIVRGIHLGSSALAILPVLESDNDD